MRRVATIARLKDGCEAEAARLLTTSRRSIQWSKASTTTPSTSLRAKSSSSSKDPKSTPLSATCR